VAERELANALEKMSPSDPCGPDALGWANGSILGFSRQPLLGPKIAISEDAGGESQNPWHQFANFLYAGKIYE